MAMETSCQGRKPVVPTHRLEVIGAVRSTSRMHKHQRLSLAGEAWLFDRLSDYQEKVAGCTVAKRADGRTGHSEVFEGRSS